MGLTQDQSAVEKWTLTAHLRTTLLNNFAHSRGKNFAE